MAREPVFPSLRYEVDRLFDTLVHTTWGRSPEAAFWKPACDVLEEADRYWIHMDVPGVRASDLSIAAEGRVLRVEGTRQRVRRRVGEHHHLVERTCGRFERAFHLPSDANAEGIHARLEDGVLSIEIPRRENRSPR